MFSRKRIAFIVTLAAAISVSTISLATLSRKGRAVAASPRMNALRRKDKKQDKPTALQVATPTADDQRKLRVSSFQGSPVEVTKVRNLQSPTWYKDVEIEVKNVSDKPIYCILAYLTFPDDYSDRSNVGALSLKFGLSEYLDIRVVGNPLDPHLKPGESCVLKIHKRYWGILRRRQERFPERVKSFVMGFGLFSFGDKTGFTSENGWADYRVRNTKVQHHRELSLPPSDRK